MTSQVKIFKNKLRSLNSPQPLLLLNAIVFIVLGVGIAALIFEAVNNSKNCDLGYQEFLNNM